MARKPKDIKAAPLGSAYDNLPDATNIRSFDLQVFVDAFIETGDRIGSYRAAGGGAGDATAYNIARDTLNRPQVQQAIVERSAQKFFELAPVSVKVIKDILEDPKADVKLKAKLAVEVVDRVQLEKHHRDKQDQQAKSNQTKTDMTAVMESFNEFIRKNPEWASKSRRNNVVVDADVELPTVEEPKQP